MPSQSINIDTRINALNAVLTNEKHQQAVDAALREANGDMSAALENLKDKEGIS